MTTATQVHALTEAQEGLWYAQRLDPGNPIFNTGQYLDIRGRLDVPAFSAAVKQALGEADALACRIIDSPGGPVQVVDERHRAALDVVDLRGERDADGVALDLMRCDMATPLDPTRDGLVAEKLLILAGDRWFWYQRVHHLVIDGYGMALLTRRILDAYAALVSGKMAAPPLGSYAKVLAADADYRRSDKREADRRFWLSTFADRPEVNGLVPGDAMTARTYLRQERAFAADLGAAVARVSATAGVPWPDVVTALIAAYLQRHVRRDEVIAGVPSMERLGTPAARVPAMAMNVLPVRFRIDQDVPLVEWLKTVGRQLRECRRHGRYRSEWLRRDLGLLGVQRRLYGALINVLPFEQHVEIPGATAAIRTLGTGPVDDITFTVRGPADPAVLHLEIDANPDLYSETLLAAHAARLADFLTRAAEADRLADVSTVTADEHRRWIVEVNDTAHPVPPVTLTELIEERLAATPRAVALVSDRETLAYEDLDRRSASLARALAAAGVTRGDVVAVALPRSIDLVLALVATLRAGAAYLPIDLSHPAERTARMLHAAQPRVVLTPASLPALLGDATPHDAVVIEPPVPDDPAYVIFTSGSTGEPKGAVIQHRAIVNRLLWMRDHYGIEADDRILQKTPATFDVSVWEFFLPFVSGATLVVAPPEAHKDPAWLTAIIRQQRITTLHFVPSMLAAFLAEPAADGLRVRRVFCSGEALPAALRDRFHEVVDSELHNLYGPTEAAVDVTYWDASRGDQSSPVPIGHPVWNTRMYVLDGRRRPVPAGVVGDVYIGGVQLAREYLGRPDLTCDRFHADPFGAPGDRIYVTGDVGYWRDDGALIFLGRSDDQVKIRGLRIELGEIEAALVASGEVARAAVVAREDTTGDKHLVAHVVPSAARDLDFDALREHLSLRLPDYMIPAAIVVLDDLPLTPSGKLNRRALPEPERGSRPRGRAPNTPTERRVAALFARVLHAAAGGTLGDLSADDDFFLLGGHSLLAVRLMALVRAEWGCDLRLGVLFANPTVARLAAAIDADAGGDRRGAASSDHGLEPLVRLVGGDGAAPPLFCIHPAGGIAWSYGALGRALTPRRDVYGVQAWALDATQAAPASLDELAAAYVARIRRVQPHGPYHLLGWSVGGIVAHAMAVHLQSIGETVGSLTLLDAYPSDRWRSQPEPEASAALRALLLIAGHDPESLHGVPLTRDAVIGFLRAQRHALADLSDEALDGVIRAVESNNRLVRGHRHAPFRGSLLYFRAALDHQDDGLDPAQWQRYVDGAIEVHDVAALHAHLTGPDAVAQIAPVLSARM